MDEIEQMTSVKLQLLDSNTWNHLTVCKKKKKKKKKLRLVKKYYLQNVYKSYIFMYV